VFALWVSAGEPVGQQRCFLLRLEGRSGRAGGRR